MNFAPGPAYVEGARAHALVRRRLRPAIELYDVRLRDGRVMNAQTRAQLTFMLGPRHSSDLAALGMALRGTRPPQGVGPWIHECGQVWEQCRHRPGDGRPLPS